MLSTEDGPNNVIKDRLMTELQAAREGLKRAKILWSAASAQSEPDHPDDLCALTSATAEYDSALNQYHTAVINFADFVLNRVSSEQ